MIKQANFVKETIWINLAESNRIIKYLTISIQEIIDVISNNVCAEIEISGTKEENTTSINRYKVLENCSKLLNEFKSLIEEVEKKRSLEEAIKVQERELELICSKKEVEKFEAKQSEYYDGILGSIVMGLGGFLFGGVVCLLGSIYKDNSRILEERLKRSKQWPSPFMI